MYHAIVHFPRTNSQKALRTNCRTLAMAVLVRVAHVVCCVVHAPCRGVEFQVWGLGLRVEGAGFRF